MAEIDEVAENLEFSMIGAVPSYVETNEHKLRQGFLD